MILDPNDNPDVFIHCWLDDSMYGRSFSPEWQPIADVYKRKHEPPYTGEPIEYTKPVRHNAKEMILSLYEPKGYVFDEPMREVPWEAENEEQKAAIKRTTGLLSCVSYMKSRYLSNVIK
jgi:hypothetical protein